MGSLMSMMMPEPNLWVSTISWVEERLRLASMSPSSVEMRSEVEGTAGMARPVAAEARRVKRVVVETMVKEELNVRIVNEIVEWVKLRWMLMVVLWELLGFLYLGRRSLYLCLESKCHRHLPLLEKLTPFI